MQCPWLGYQSPHGPQDSVFMALLVSSKGGSCGEEDEIGRRKRRGPQPGHKLNKL